MDQYTKSLTILFVEDDKTTQLLYSAIFENILKKIIIAKDGEDGFQKFLDNSVDIVVSDYKMPKLDGLGMIKKIRDIDQNVPIILVSSIEETSIIIQSLQLGVNNFVKKPINNTKMLEALDNVSKILIANQFLQEKRNKEKKKIQKLQEQNTYNSYQEDLAFAKELNILKNDFYYQMTSVTDESVSLIDFLYQPLDVVSGDAYTAKKIDEFKTFYLIVDGMGKGLSASLSAMMMTSFTSHLVDEMIGYRQFNLSALVQESMSYIQKTLLDEEALAIEYMLIDNKKNTLSFAKFAMPVSLLQNHDDEIIRLKSNNPPMSKYNLNFNVDSYDISYIHKFLFYSDGIVENETIYNSKFYSHFIEEDFKNAFTKKELTDSLFSKLSEQEDDFTMAFIHKIHFEKNSHEEIKEFDTSLKAIDEASEWYDTNLHKFCLNTKAINRAGLVFTELFMNAYEHGNLSVDVHHKHQLIEDDKYFETLLEYEKKCTKKITVSLRRIEHAASAYLITIIKDEGNGFDTQILDEIFKNSQKFNGRGVYVSKKNSMGIYYNSKGNVVLFLNKIKKKKEENEANN